MQNNFKDIIYNNYYSYHTKELYGVVTINSIKEQFSAWEYYFSEFLPKDKSSKILDAGCGNGGFIYWINELGYSNANGIDISKEMIDLGKSLKINNISQTDIYEHLQNNKYNFDVIFCRDVLEHLAKPEVFEMFKLFNDSLKVGGKIIVQVPNGFSPNYSKIFYSDFTHETLFSEAVLNQIIQSTGFKSLYVKEVTPVPNGIKSSVRFLLWISIKQWFKLIQLIETGSSKGFYSQNIIACITK